MRTRNASVSAMCLDKNHKVSFVLAAFLITKHTPLSAHKNLA